ncbi:MAG TPA: CoA pyrophosphatase [Propionibacteriaceae bacterium]
MITETPTWLAPLSAALAEPIRLDEVVAIRPGVGGRAAAVLVLIAEGARGPEILFVERASTLRTHASQIAFPGGAADPEDVDLIDTALREAEEETGVDRAGIDVLGQLPPAYVSVSGFDVTAVIAWWRHPTPVRAVDLAEVATVPVVPVSVLTDPELRFRVHHPSGYTGPAFAVDDHLIWGLTAHLLDGVLDLAGWQQPWDRTRQREIPARYLTGRPDSGGPDAH